MPRRAGNLLRFVDRYAGIPALSLFTVIPRRARPADADIRRIGILKTAAIGDTLLLAGIPDALKARFPDARVAMITGRDNAAAVGLLGPAIDAHAIVDPTRPLAAMATLRDLKLDILLECGPWPRIDALLGVLSGARYVVGFRVPGQSRHAGFDRIVEHDRNAHQLENFRSLARAIGVERFPDPAIVPVFADIGPELPFAVFHPWSGGYMGHVKQWANDRWVELGRRVSRDHGLEILVSGGSADREASTSLSQALNAAGCRSRSIAGDYPLDQLASLLVRSRLVVSVNTGVMHLAALVGAPTISLEGPVPVRRWGPLGPSARSVVTTLPDCGYLDLGFEYAGHRLDCMDGVSVDAVEREVRALL